MIKKYYWAMAVMAAFVAGTIATATPVFAPPPGDDDDGEGGWKAAVADLQMQVDDLETQAGNDNDTDPTNELQTLTTGDTVTNFGGLDLDDPADFDSIGCGSTAFISSIKIGSCPGGDLCVPGDDLSWSATCTDLGLSP